MNLLAQLPLMNERELIIKAPSKNATNFQSLYPFTENSSVTISVQAIYTNVPAAREDITTSTISPADEAKIPIVTPKGVAIENKNTNCLTSLKSFGKVFTSEIPSALDATPL